MAVYNTERYLKQAIESILNQSFSDFELIIVDDGSTDHCPQILTEFCQCDSRIKVFTQKNSGIGAATQRAISESSGQYIVIMDSDDISLPHRLAYQKKYLDDHPDIDAVGSQWRMLNSQGKNVGTDTHPANSVTIEILMFAFFSLQHSTTMIRKNAIEKIGGYSTDRSCLVPDYDLFMRLQLNGSKFANLPRILFIWNLNPASTTHSTAAKQTYSVFKIQESGFSTLLQTSPTAAKSICKSVIYNFPAGTWQDHKIKLLIPGAGDSLLYKTWLSLPVTTTKEQLYRDMVLWLRNPSQHYQSLSTKLIANQSPWLASLVIAQQGHGRCLPASALDLSVLPCKEKSCSLSLFVPFINSEVDFLQRLDQAQQLLLTSGLSIELLIFSAGDKPLPVALIPDQIRQFSHLIIDSPFSWEQALISANGYYFFYLEESYRFHIEQLMPLIHSAITDKIDLLYMLDTRYFSEALDESGQPILDDSPSPKWTRATLLGKDRLTLSGFLHQRSLLKNLEVNLGECGALSSRVLGKHLAMRHSFSIHQRVIDYLIPAISLEQTPEPVFQRTILDWFLDFGMTQLPSENNWSYLSKSESEKYAHALSDAWIKKTLFLFPGNESTIKQFFLDKIANPLHFPLFRYLLLHNKKSILSSLWYKRQTKQFISASIYCTISIIVNRLSSLFSK